MKDFIDNCVLEFDARKHMDYINCMYNKNDYPDSIVCEKSVKDNSIFFNIGKLSQSTFFPGAFTLKYKDECFPIELFEVNKDEIPINILHAIEYGYSKLKSHIVIMTKYSDKPLHISLTWENDLTNDIYMSKIAVLFYLIGLNPQFSTPKNAILKLTI